MSVTTPVLVLPGLGNSGPQHWQTRWALRHPDWQRVNLGNWDSPVCDDWVRALDVAVQACPSPPILVAHSLACLLVAHWASRVRATVKGALLVAVPDPSSPRFPTSARGFAPVPMQPHGFPSTVVASVNDPFGSSTFAQRCADAWGSRFVDIGEACHINANSGLGDWAEGYVLFQNLAG